MLHLIYTPCKDQIEARTIGTALVKEKLAACVNIIKDVESIYQWNGELEKSDEVILIAKTKSELVGKLTERVKELHSYEYPCILSFPAESLNQEYSEWLLQSLQ